MKMEAAVLDYRKWIERAVVFTERLRSLPGIIDVDVRVDPPISREEVEINAGKLRLGIPSPISDFLIHGSRNCWCKYWWKPPRHLSPLLEKISGSSSRSSIYGGARICNMNDFEYDQSGCYDQGDSYEEGTRDRKCWIFSVPIVNCGNGDCAALYIADDVPSQEYPVIYLDHDGGGTGSLLAPSFDQFLINWESLCYIGPSLMLFYFLDEHGSIIREKRELLRELFSMSSI